MGQIDSEKCINDFYNELRGVRKIYENNFLERGNFRNESRYPGEFYPSHAKEEDSFFKNLEDTENFAKRGDLESAAENLKLLGKEFDSFERDLEKVGLVEEMGEGLERAYNNLQKYIEFNK